MTESVHGEDATTGGIRAAPCCFRVLVKGLLSQRVAPEEGRPVPQAVQVNAPQETLTKRETYHYYIWICMYMYMYAYLKRLRGGPRIRVGSGLDYYTIYYTFSTFPCHTPPDPSTLCIKPAYSPSRSVINSVIIEIRRVTDPRATP